MFKRSNMILPSRKKFVYTCSESLYSADDKEQIP